VIGPLAEVLISCAWYMTSTMDAQDRFVATLREHESELRAAGVASLSLFGSFARREERAESDVDLAVRLDPNSHVGLFRFVALESRLTELLGRTVQLLPEPTEDSRLRTNLDRDSLRVF
jgi:predicted nucleotidyltransferase